MRDGADAGDIELIVVNDGSTDASRELLHTLAAAHAPRVQVFHKDRKGPYPRVTWVCVTQAAA